MESFLGRYKNILVLVAVLVAQFIGLAVQVRRPRPNAPDKAGVRLIRSWAVGVISPPEKGLRATGRGVRGVWSNYLDLRNVRQQNKDLQQQVNRLRMEQAALLEDARQGQRLQKLLAFKEHYVYSTVPAEVIGTSGTDQSRVLYINKGSADGLKPDMAVITPDGIVGKLKDVFRHTSQVLEINDQTSGAGVLLETTRLRGVLRGNAVGQPEIVNMLPDERVKTGERVITSGGDSIYPRGLPVGTVERIVPDVMNPPYVDIVLKPSVNLAQVEEVLVITQVSSQMPPSEQQDIAQSEADAQKMRAADILAERLPGLTDPNNPNAAADDPAKGVSADGSVAPPMKPPQPLRADRYSPNSMPPAADMIPGKATAMDSASVDTPTARPAAALAAKPAASSVSAASGVKTAAPRAGEAGSPHVKPATGHPAAHAPQTAAPARPHPPSGESTREQTH